MGKKTGEMGFSCDDIKSQLLFLFLLIAGTALVQALQPSAEANAPAAVIGRCGLKDIVTVFVATDNGSSRGDNLYHYLIIVENRCEYCNAKGVGVEVSGYSLGNEIVNLTRTFAPGGDQYVLNYANSKQVGGVSPATATFYECRD